MRKDEVLKNNEFGRLLASLHARKGWSQEDAAAHLVFSPRTYSDWVTGKRLPSSEQLKHIAATFKLNQADEDELYRVAAQTAPRIHNPPFPPNPFFTGREDEMKQLEAALEENGSMALTQPVSLKGLGGIGKTQIALAYAYSSFQHVYRAILWVNAASQATLQASYDDLTQRLDLPEKQEHDANLRIQAVKDWFATHTNWLLIMDNADDLQLARSFFPTVKHGYILLTTRSQFAGDIGAKQIEIDKMTTADALLFLLRRSHTEEENITPETAASTVCQDASQLVQLLDAHPLALDQAGAYIAERKLSFTEYIERYKEARYSLLDRRRAIKSEHGDHLHSVVVTFRLSFEKAAEQHPMATEILHFCAFLEPDTIPEELFQHEDSFKCDELAFDEGIIALQRYSLIKSNTEDKMFSIHRLVQAVLSDTMPGKLKWHWQHRVLLALNAAFPEGEFDNCSPCERLMPHVYNCIAKEYDDYWYNLDFQQRLAIRGIFYKSFIYRIGKDYTYHNVMCLLEMADGHHQDYRMNYMHPTRGSRSYRCAELLYQRGITILEKLSGGKHPVLVSAYRALRMLRHERGCYSLLQAIFDDVEADASEAEIQE